MDEIKPKKCAECKEPLPATADYYNRHTHTKDGLMRICKKCQGKRIANGHKRPPKKSAAKKTPTEHLKTAAAVIKKSKNSHKLTIDFSKHTQHYEKLREIAEAELRSVENQALYLLINGFEAIESITVKDNHHGVA